MIQPSWFYTAPVDEIAARRGDPLGLQAVAERVAEVLAPGLSNRTVDARWISILCWCLREGQNAWRTYGNGGDPASQGSIGKHIYPWIKPLELLWVARTVEFSPEEGRGRQLPGVRPIRQWLGQDKRPGRFSFAASSYEQYRYTGSYGGYRATLRALEGMTENGAGWLPGTNGQKLAEIVSAHVKGPDSYRRRAGSPPTPEAYWLKTLDWTRSSAEFLPTQLEQPRRLDGDERLILRDALFEKKRRDDGQMHSLRRLKVVEAISRSKASNRPDLMRDLAIALKDENDLKWLPYLASFSALADAGTAAMNACWRAVSKATDRVPMLDEVVGIPDVRLALDELVCASRRWHAEGSNSWSSRAGALSQTVLLNTQNLPGILSRLIQFHLQYGSGLKWLIVDGKALRPVARLRDGDASFYRYRLPALMRLAKQCGVTNVMPAFLKDNNEAAHAQSQQEPA
ncbi:MAG: hypothetical protein E2591_29125 [Achromobacter sp.]|uniref:hypothetical protein n=1 Tax=Achromobacter sp. TaxID=134375 RepID=UPI0012C93E17|nr:hypothetical protein [Achromobacter sp.]MPS82138.1 hypothetical protein [Achromobacter sp.]